MIWNWWGVPGAFVCALALTFAVAALRVKPQRRVNRLLAIVLVLEGLYTAGNFGFVFFVTGPGWARGFSLLGALGMATLPLEYLAFLGEALRTPLVRPLRSRPGKWIIHLAAITAAGAVLLVPGAFITPVFQPAWAPWNFTYTGIGPRTVQFHGLVSLFGLIVSIHAFVLSPVGSTARGRAKWFIVAFGIRDAFIAFIQILMPVIRPLPFWGDLVYNPIQGMVYALYVPLLAYSVLRHQLLDIDLKVRFALTQGTAGAVIAATFLVVSEGLESVVPVDGLVAAIVLAVVIAAVLRPAQKMAERFANRVMPGVRAEADYFKERRLTMFRDALEAAFDDGEITQREEAILERLRVQFGISRDEEQSLRREVRSGIRILSGDT